jgi:hypothetical protein
VNTLDELIPTPRWLESNGVDVSAPPERAWAAIRHLDLASTPIARLLFALRTSKDESLSIDRLVSTQERPGFQILIDEPPRTFAVGAIGKVWKLDIPFVHVESARDFAHYASPGEVKVAWAIEVAPLATGGSRIELEVRVDATDDASWDKFRAYFTLIGPGSRLIRHLLLARLARDLGTPADADDRRTLPGDDLLDAREQMTHAVTIHAKPEAIWPWLVQMGCSRAGFYSIDWLDNGGVPSAREIHPEWQQLRVGDTVPFKPGSDEGFEVLRIVPQRALVLGNKGAPGQGLVDTWAFALEPLDENRTRLFARVRVAPSVPRAQVAMIRPVHHLMESAQLRHLAARAEGRLSRDSGHDVLEAGAGAAIMLANLLTPFLRGARTRWGIAPKEAEGPWPGDELVPSPQWGWTHAVEIEARAEDVWPWVAPIGADRAGFYSYQFLENVAGCELRNAETVHPEWEVRKGSTLSLHPKVPPLQVVSVVPGRSFVAYGPADEAARAAGKPWAAVTWAFFVEPLEPTRCRLVSRYRCAMSDDAATRLSLGPTLVEPIGFAMDRRMLLGVKERAQRTAHAP